MAGVSVTGQGPTVVAVDAGGHPLRPAVTWADWGCQAEADELGVYAGYSALARILWVARHDPDVYARTRWFFESYDYLTFRLTGEPVTIVSLPGYEPWNVEQLEGAGLDSEQVSVPHGALRHRGRRRQRAGGRGHRAAAGYAGRGGHRLCVRCNWLGLGMTEKGRLCDIGGTSEGVGLSWDEAITDYANGIHPMPNPAGAGGFLRRLHVQRRQRAVVVPQRILHGRHPFRARVGRHRTHARRRYGMVALPYLMGERAPVQDPLARGCFFGVGPGIWPSPFRTSRPGRRRLRHSANRGGVGDRRRPCRPRGRLGRRDGYRPGTQIKADVLGRPVYIPAVTETGLLGAAILARSR